MSFSGLVKIPVTERLAAAGFAKETAEDVRATLTAWLSRQICVFELDHQKMWQCFKTVMQEVCPNAIRDACGELVHGTVRIVHRYQTQSKGADGVSEPQLWCETIWLPRDALPWIVECMFYGDKVRADLAIALREESLPIFLAHAVLIIGRDDAELLKWALGSYGTVNIAGGTSLDIRGLDYMMAPEPHKQIAMPHIETKELDQRTYLLFARLVFNHVFAQMSAQRSGVSNMGIRVRLVHERPLFDMFCRYLSRSAPLTSSTVARVVPGPCAEAVARLRLPLLGSMMSAAAECVIRAYNRLAKEFESEEATALRLAAKPRVGARDSQHVRATDAAQRTVDAWCCDRVMYDIFLRCRFAAAVYDGMHNPLWRVQSSQPRETRINVCGMKLLTYAAVIEKLTAAADVSGLERVCTFVYGRGEQRRSLVYVEVCGCSQFELFQSIAKVVPLDDVTFWTSMCAETVVIDQGPGNSDGAGILLVCSELILHRIEALLLAGLVRRASVNDPPPRTLETFRVSYHAVRALLATHPTEAVAVRASWCSAVWRLIVQWARAPTAFPGVENVDWARFDTVMRAYAKCVARQHAGNPDSMAEYFQSKTRHKLIFVLMAHLTGLGEVRFRQSASNAGKSVQTKRDVAERLASALAKRMGATWLDKHSLVALKNASEAGWASMLSESSLISDLLYCVVMCDEPLVVRECQRHLGTNALRGFASLLEFSGNSILEDSEKTAVPFGHHIAQQVVTLFGAMPSTPTSVTGSPAASSTRSWRAQAASDLKRYSRQQPGVVLRDDDDGYTNDSTGAGAGDVNECTLAELVLLDVVLTWENVYRQSTRNATELHGVAQSLLWNDGVVLGPRSMVSTWRSFVDRVNFDIPYGVASCGILRSRCHLPVVQFMNRKVVFSDDVRAILFSATSSKWCAIVGGSHWWGLESLDSAFEQRTTSAPALVHRASCAKAAVTASTNAHYDPRALFEQTMAARRRSSNASTTQWYSPVHVMRPEQYSPTSPAYSRSSDEDEDDEDDDDVDSEDDDALMAALTAFCEHGSHMPSGRGTMR